MRLYRGSPPFGSMSRRRIRRFLLTMPVVLCVYLGAADENGLYQVYYRQRRVEALRQDLDRIRAENARLEEEVALLKHDLGTVERIAREKYGMVRPNESVYMVYSRPPGAGAQEAP